MRLTIRDSSRLIGVLLCSIPVAYGQGRSDSESPIFEKQILPILEQNCAKCHSGTAPQSGLDVRTRATLLRGGSKGPAIVVGDPGSSLLYQRVQSGEMPLGGAPLNESQRESIRQWIAQGAKAENPSATVTAGGISPSDRSHWAFQPPRRPDVPAVSAADRVRTPIDAFLLSELGKHGLSFAQDASRVRLLRRATFDLTGLPPTREEVEAFVRDPAPDAYEKVVDRLLASPRYGERWGRHWLDLAGYADSEGVLAADAVRPNAWRYRDYVIRAFNSDKPYDRFLKEQLAGDELSEYYRYDKIPPAAVELIEATGFLRTAVDATRDDFLPADYAEYQWRTLFDTEQIVVSSLMGLSIQCARCHDHKYEPLSQRDYYGISAIFQGAIRPSGAVIASDKRAIVLATRAEKAAAAEVNGPLDMIIKALGDLKAARTQQYRAKHPDGEEVTDEDLRKTFPEYARISDSLSEQIKTENKNRVKLTTVRAIYDIDSSPPPAHVLTRGDPQSPAEEVRPGVPAVLDDPARPFRVAPLPGKAPSTGRRLAFAEWLTRPDHPLTARVFVNHIWEHHFGTGLVPTPDNFGKSGARPTNQALLDWLATEFVQQGWKIKPLHRLILTSTAYRQDSAASPDGLRADPDDTLLWRYPRRRLEGEVIRDAILAVSGELDLKMYGDPVATKVKPSGEIVPIGEAQNGRRSVYQLVRRSAPQSFLEAFDAPIMETNCTRRAVSTSAPQALAFMNSDFVRAQALRFAKRVLQETPPAGPTDSNPARRAVEFAFGREPNPVELDNLITFLDRQRGRYPGLTSQQLTERLYGDLCQVLMSTNEFVYVD